MNITTTISLAAFGISVISLFISALNFGLNYYSNQERRRGEITKKIADHLDYLLNNESQTKVFKNEIEFELERLTALSTHGEHNDLINELATLNTSIEKSLNTITSLKDTLRNYDLMENKNSETLIGLQKIDILMKSIPMPIAEHSRLMKLIKKIYI